MLDNSLSETICCFYSCVLFSNIFHKITRMGKKGSYYIISMINLIFWNLNCFFLLILMFHNNVIKISEILNKCYVPGEKNNFKMMSKAEKEKKRIKE